MFTATLHKVISDAGQPTSRQQAKAHTFAPLFGATGYGRSLRQRRRTTFSSLISIRGLQHGIRT
jgi:hypothetical protein